MDIPNLYYTPRFDRAAIEQDLKELLVPGPLADGDLERRIAAFAERHRVYRACYPYGLWAPGLAVTREMRNLTELYLPMDEIRRAFDRFFSLVLRFIPLTGASAVHNATSWLDLLRFVQPLQWSPDPTAVLSGLLADEELRRCFVFANFMPARHGGGFGRYPGQSEFLRGWLKLNRPRLAGGVRCLDAACGSGEGTYELALLLIECGFAVDSIHVEGVTLDPFELFSAAHCFFPHDPRRGAACRMQANRLFSCGAAEKIDFSREDIMGADCAREESEDVILCNGLLGGPFLHEYLGLRETVLKLSRRLGRGGILMAANRFHGGWTKQVDDEVLRKIFAESGLRVLPVAEGVAGEKEG